MAAEIIPIELILTTTSGITLWAPTWEEDGENWEAFLGHGDELYLFPGPADLAAFIRTNDEHDLVDHPNWEQARRLLPDELVPDDDHRFDIVGVPNLVADDPDVWTLAELTDTVAILRSLAAVCGLDAVDEVLDSSAGFAALAEGAGAFIGRPGRKLWNEIGTVVAKRWDTVIDALDALVTTPAVDADARAAAQRDLDAVAGAVADPGVAGALESDSRVGAAGGTAENKAESTAESDAEPLTKAEEEHLGLERDRDPELSFWDEVGIDCVSITTGGRTGWTLRCYLGDDPVFLSSAGRIKLFRSPAALEEYLADPTADNALSGLDAWTTIRAVAGGEASVIAAPENTYRLDGLDTELLDGAVGVGDDVEPLSLAIELLTDGGQARDDAEVAAAVGSATPLGNLLRSITRPDPDRLPPMPPFDDEVAAWRSLVTTFESTLDWQ